MGFMMLSLCTPPEREGYTYGVYTHYIIVYIRVLTNMGAICAFQHITVYYSVYTHSYNREEHMKITRRSDTGKGGHLLISVPANRVPEVESALHFLEAQRNQRGSQIVIALLVQAAKRRGWTFAPATDLPAPPRG
jgi:hypothetical protein